MNYQISIFFCVTFVKNLYGLQCYVDASKSRNISAVHFVATCENPYTVSNSNNTQAQDDFKCVKLVTAFQDISVTISIKDCLSSEESCGDFKNHTMEACSRYGLNSGVTCSDLCNGDSTRIIKRKFKFNRALIILLVIIGIVLVNVGIFVLVKLVKKTAPSSEV